MKREVVRLVIVIGSLAVIAQTIGLWWLTGRAGLTRYYDPERAAHERRTAALDALLDDPAGVPPAPPGPPNSFALGLLPFGFGRHALSVITIALPAVAALIAAVCMPRAARPIPSDSPP